MATPAYYSPPGQSVTAFLTDDLTGLVGTLTFGVVDDEGTPAVAAGTAGILEISTGQYARSFTAPTQAGNYLIIWDNAGTTHTDVLVVTGSAITFDTDAGFPAGITVERARRYVGESLRTDDWNLLDEDALPAAVDFVRGETGRQLDMLPVSISDPQITVTKHLRGRRSTVVYLPDLWEVGEIAHNGIVLDATDYELDTQRYPGYFTQLKLARPSSGTVEVTGRFGFNPVPPGLRDAIYALAARRFQERAASYADSAPVMDGTMIHYYRQMPPSIKAEVEGAVARPLIA